MCHSATVTNEGHRSERGQRFDQCHVKRNDVDCQRLLNCREDDAAQVIAVLFGSYELRSEIGCISESPIRWRHLRFFVLVSPHARRRSQARAL